MRKNVNTKSEYVKLNQNQRQVHSCETGTAHIHLMLPEPKRCVRYLQLELFGGFVAEVTAETLITREGCTQNINHDCFFNNKWVNV